MYVVLKTNLDFFFYIYVLIYIITRCSFYFVKWATLVMGDL